ncbi:GIY-YIG nuclease family protein [Arthrobacter alpinus]|nr:GIY-YIG nuclease family protein [Arthrobacter alpinus]
MDANAQRELEPLIFHRYSMEDGVPVSMLFTMAGRTDVCGIYILEFKDGAQYVGQTINIVRRFGDHQHTHGDIIAFGFAICERQMLDIYERAVIKLQQQGNDLRNRLLTDLPGGRSDLEIEVSETATVKLPWDRDARSTILNEPKKSMVGRFWQLTNRPDYSNIRTQIGRYIHETIPSPSQTAGLLWTLTALPSTNRAKDRRRLLTLNVCNIEALYVTEYDLQSGGAELEWSLNAWPSGLKRELQSLNRWGRREKVVVEPASYKSSGPVERIASIGSDTFSRVLDQNTVIEAAYRLNVTMMRRSKSVFAKFHNQPFAADIFNEINGRMSAEEFN